MPRFRRNIRTPARYQTAGVSPVRPRSDVLMNIPGEDEQQSSTPAPESEPTPLPAPQTPLVPRFTQVTQVAASPRPPPVDGPELMEHSIGNRGGVTRLYVANTFHNLTDTMKLVIGTECIEVLGTWELAAEYLSLNQEECHMIKQIADNEKDREARLDVSIKSLEARQLQILLSDCDNKEEKWLEEWNNIYAQPPSPDIPVVRRDDVDLAQRFLRGRCTPSAILNKVLQGLPDYIGQDFSQGFRAVVHDGKLLNEDDEEDEDEIVVEPLGDIQQPLPSSPRDIQRSLPSSFGANHHLPRIPSHLSIVQTADSEAD